jgi:hypothetical protein
MSSDPISVANRWIEAYNSGDLKVIRELCADDIKMTHHNRGFNIVGPDGVVKAMEEFAPVGPDKAFSEPLIQFTDGQRVVTQQKWGFTAQVDVPPFGAKAGDKVQIDVACIWTISDGRVVEYHDYG